MPRAGFTGHFPNPDPFQHDHDDPAAAESHPLANGKDISESKPSNSNSHDGETLPKGNDKIAPETVETAGGYDDGFK